MEKKLILIHNKEMETLDIWFGDPEREAICEEVGGGLSLRRMKTAR